MRPLYVTGYPGLGDAVYARPFVSALARERDVYVRTAWPELWWDSPRVLPVRTTTEVRTAKYAAARSSGPWHVPPAEVDRLALTYMDEHGRVAGVGTVLDALAARSGVGWGGAEAFRFRLRDEWVARAREVLRGAPLGRGLSVDASTCIVRPPVIRREWPAPARNPDPAAWNEAVDAVREAGVRTIAVAWLEPGEEWIAPGVEPIWDQELLVGEEPWYVVAAMMAVAGMVLTTHSFALVLGAAVGASVFGVYGGHQPPSVMEHPDMGRIRSVAPEPFCYCGDPRHECGDKRITGVGDEVRLWIRTVDQ